MFAKRAALDISEGYSSLTDIKEPSIDGAQYNDYKKEYEKSVLSAIEQEKNK